MLKAHHEPKKHV